MSRDLNKVILVGNVGWVETQLSKSGNAVSNLAIATNQRWKDKKTGEYKERVEWHKIVFFGNKAYFVENYLKKGCCLYIEGYLKTDKITNKFGIEHFVTKIVGKDIQILKTPGQS